MVILDFMSNALEPAQHIFLLFFKNADLNSSYNIVQYEKLGLLKDICSNSSIVISLLAQPNGVTDGTQKVRNVTTAVTNADAQLL